MTNRILVTGGAGFIGSHLVDLLISRGERVTVLDDFSVGVRENLSEADHDGDLRIVQGSITDPSAVTQAFEGVDRVYHLAVQCVRRSLSRPVESHDVNATGSLRVLDEALRRNVQRFIYCSSSEVYGNSSGGKLNEDKTLCQPMTVYGAAKLAGELYANAYYRTYGLPVVVVRPFNAYGPRAYQKGTRAEVLPRIVARVLNGLAPVIFGDGSNGRDFTYVTEVAEGLLRAGSNAAAIGETVNVAYGQIITVGELATSVLRELGSKDITINFLAPRPGDVLKLHADCAKARRLLGFRAVVPFEEGLRRYIKWVRSKYADPRDILDDEIINWNLKRAVHEY